jgi:hypothetical protein
LNVKPPKVDAVVVAGAGIVAGVVAAAFGAPNIPPEKALPPRDNPPPAGAADGAPKVDGAGVDVAPPNRPPTAGVADAPNEEIVLWSRVATVNKQIFLEITHESRENYSSDFWIIF